MHPANTRQDEHPCLPIHLLARIVLMSSDDPFLGIGTTAIAEAKRSRVAFWGTSTDLDAIPPQP